MRRTPFPGLLVPLVLIAALAGGGVFLNLRKQVTLVVDGEPSAVQTSSSSVADLLAEQGISVDQHDEITPPAAASLADGMQVQVQLAKEITLLLNGAERTVYVTGETVQDVLQHVNVRTERDSYLQPSRGATVEDGDVIVYKEAVDVRLTVDGHTRQVITNEDHVGMLLDSLGITLNLDDEITPPPDTELASGMEVRVTRVQERQLTQDVAIPFSTETRSSSDYMQGVRKVVRAGTPGLRRATFEVRLEDGREVSRRQLSSQVIRQPVSQIVVVGTRPPRTQSGIASWYHRTGMVAAHQTLPFGTEVKVTNVSTGTSVTVVINDRGPYVSGRIIDLSDDAFARLAPLGAGTVNVRISW